MVADTVERLDAEVQAHERHVRAPHGVVESAVDEWVQGLFARVAPGSVAAVVSEGDGLGERRIEPDGARDAGRDLGDLEGVREARAHVVIGKDKDLGLAGEAAKGARVQDAVAVTLETGAELVRFFVAGPVPGPVTSRRARGEHRVELFLALGKGTGERWRAVSDVNRRRRVAMGDRDVVGRALVALHRGGPAAAAL